MSALSKPSTNLACSFHFSPDCNNLSLPLPPQGGKKIGSSNREGDFPPSLFAHFDPEELRIGMQAYSFSLLLGDCVV